MTTVTPNIDQRLFVLNTGGGFSCLGFDVVFKRLKQYAEFLGLPQPAEADIGQMHQYEAYRTAESAVCQKQPSQTWFDPETDPQVKSVLEQYRLSRKKIRVFLGSTQTGRDWCEEYDVVGRISRSTGALKAPLLISGNEPGGPALLTACILRLLDVETGKELYRHPLYETPAFEVVPSKEKGYKVEVLRDSQVYARFKTDTIARNWVAFMRGERMRA